MLDQLVQMVQPALSERWGSRLPQLIARSRSFSEGALVRVRSALPATKEVEVDRVVREAYMAGYRQAYLDGILDLIESAGSDTGSGASH